MARFVRTSCSVSWRRRVVVAGAILGVSLTVVSAALAAAGVLDTSFGVNGKVVTDLTTGGDWAADAAIQADGKIVVAGGAGSNSGFALARYNGDGTLDTSFCGDGGRTTSPRATTSPTGWRIQADGKIVAVGDAGYGGANTISPWPAYNTDGSLDTSFAGDGKVTTDFSRSERHRERGGHPGGRQDRRGRLRGDYGSNADFALARYNADGILDTSFDGDGKADHRLRGATTGANAWRSRRTARSSRRRASGADCDFALARYNADGTLDTSFDGDGKLTTDFGRGCDEATAWRSRRTARSSPPAAATPPPTATSRWPATTRRLARHELLRRRQADDRLRRRDDGAYGVAIQADGKIVAAGEPATAARTDFALARYNSDGTLDTSLRRRRQGDERTSRRDRTWRSASRSRPTAGSSPSGASGSAVSNHKVALARYLAD